MPRKSYGSPRPEVGNRIRHYRTRRGLTLEQLEALTGVEWRTIQKYETRPGRLRVDQLRIFADALGVTPAQLVEDENGLTEEERAWIDRLRQWDPATRATVEAVAEAQERFRKAGN